ncbi:MAG: hypothetical protein PPP55_08895 [Halorubrum sp.]
MTRRPPLTGLPSRRRRPASLGERIRLVGGRVDRYLFGFAHTVRAFRVGVDPERDRIDIHASS